jgi:putative transposase
MEEAEKEHFRMLMRMCERFTGCRVLSYCLMSSHFHILLEVTPVPTGGISDEDLLSRLEVFYNEAQLAAIAQEMADARVIRKLGELELRPLNAAGVPLTKAEFGAQERRDAAARVEKIRQRYTQRMHDLSGFMKSLLERFTKWFNRLHSRRGRLWEDKFSSVIVEDCTAARMMAVQMDLNPVRAGLLEDPAEYRWCGYGEAIGGGKKGNGKKSREGLVRAWFSSEGVGFEAERWPEVSRVYRRTMGIALGRKLGPVRN